MPDLRPGDRLGPLHMDQSGAMCAPLGRVFWLCQCGAARFYVISNKLGGTASLVCVACGDVDPHMRLREAPDA